MCGFPERQTQMPRRGIISSLLSRQISRHFRSAASAWGQKELPSAAQPHAPTPTRACKRHLPPQAMLGPPRGILRLGRATQRRAGRAGRCQERLMNAAPTATDSSWRWCRFFTRQGEGRAAGKRRRSDKPVIWSPTLLSDSVIPTQQDGGEEELGGCQQSARHKAAPARLRSGLQLDRKGYPGGKDSHKPQSPSKAVRAQYTPQQASCWLGRQGRIPAATAGDGALLPQALRTGGQRRGIFVPPHGGCCQLRQRLW